MPAKNMIPVFCVSVKSVFFFKYNFPSIQNSNIADVVLILQTQLKNPDETVS